jgi:CDP-2,3-bis-(O-geranylgeranyl)-sn-glycerol synthase
MFSIYSMFDINLFHIIIFLLPPFFANAVPVIFGGGLPIDLGKKFVDGARIFGDGKTYRGFFSGVLCGILVGFVQFVFLNDIFLILIAIGSSMGTMFGDLFGSFIKRRIGLERGKPSLILDQLMFIVFAIIFSYNYIIASQYFSILSIQSIFLILLITFFTHKFSNIIANKVGLKKVPW